MRWWVWLLIALLLLTGGSAVVLDRAGVPLPLHLAGRTVGIDTAENGEGWIDTDPQLILAAVNADLVGAGEMPISLDVLALARCLRSEHGRDSDIVQEWVAWAVRNEAGEGEGKIFRRLTAGGGAADGHFARQRIGGRYAATQLDQTWRTIRIARAVCAAPRSSDPTGGARHFYSPRAQDAGHRRYLQWLETADPKLKKWEHYTLDAAAVRAKWLAGGSRSCGSPPGVSTYKVEFFT